MVRLKVRTAAVAALAAGVLVRLLRKQPRPMKFAIGLLVLSAGLLSGAAAKAGSVSATYIPLAQGTTVDLTQQGTLDWVKFGNGENGSTSFLNTTKIGNPVFNPDIQPVGTAPPGSSVSLIAFTGGNILNFKWTNGNFGMYNGTGPVDTVVTETLVPAANSYPPGLGATFTASASAGTRQLDVYVQGFDSDMVLTASLSGGGSTTITVSPTVNPPSDPSNFYAIGDFQILYSGAGETLTISAVADGNPIGAQSAFPNAGIFAATAQQLAVPEPATLALLIPGGLTMVAAAVKRRRAVARSAVN